MRHLWILVLALSLLVSACATTGPNGVEKPTVATNPPSYLKSFPLNKISKAQLIQDLGLPDKNMKMDGDLYLSYELGEGYGKREYSYVIRNGVVVDVRYNDQGPYNGSDAKNLQQGE